MKDEMTIVTINVGMTWVISYYWENNQDYDWKY